MTSSHSAAGEPLPIEPPFPGVAFRRFQGESDYAAMARILTVTSAVDGGYRAESADRIAASYAHLYNSDPYEDMVLAVVDGEVVAYSRCLWEKELAGARAYKAFGWVDPQFRLRGIGSAMTAWNLDRLANIASSHPDDGTKKIVVMGAQDDVGARAIYERHGFAENWYLADMRRDLTLPIPEAPLPDGLVVRTPLSTEYRKVFDADVEAFRDHHGETEPQESWYDEWRAHPTFDPTLWKVAWDGDEVAGQVRTYVDAEQNRLYGLSRGWTEDISTRRPYRGRGLARALLVQSLEMLRDMGYAEAALSVHTENLTGAYRLYESVGFEIESQTIFWERPLAGS